jgi:hypothetical protein
MCITWLAQGIVLSDLIEAWKSVSARNVNAAVGRRGSLWQADYFDVLIRDERQLRNVVKYVLENPAKAGLRDWKWSGFSTAAFDRQIA